MAFGDDDFSMLPVAIQRKYFFLTGTIDGADHAASHHQELAG